MIRCSYEAFFWIFILVYTLIVAGAGVAIFQNLVRKRGRR